MTELVSQLRLRKRSADKYRNGRKVNAFLLFFLCDSLRQTLRSATSLSEGGKNLSLTFSFRQLGSFFEGAVTTVTEGVFFKSVLVSLTIIFPR